MSEGIKGQGLRVPGADDMSESWIRTKIEEDAAALHELAKPGPAQFGRSEYWLEQIHKRLCEISAAAAFTADHGSKESKQ